MNRALLLSHSLFIMANATATSTAHTPGPWLLRPNGEITAQTWVEKWDNYICRMPFSSLEEAAEIGATQLPNAHLIAAAPELRQASQELYDRLQEYLDVSDDQLIEQGHEALVAAMDAMEAAWHKADGTVPETH